MHLTPKTEIDPNSLHYASGQILHNTLSSRISLYPTSPTDPIFKPLFDSDLLKERKVEATMCNPPFYSSEEEIERLRGMKEGLPLAVRLRSLLSLSLAESFLSQEGKEILS